MKGDRVDFVGIVGDGKDRGDGVVGSVGFDEERAIRFPMPKNRGGREGRFEPLEGGPTAFVEIPWS